MDLLSSEFSPWSPCGKIEKIKYFRNHSDFNRDKNNINTFWTFKKSIKRTDRRRRIRRGQKWFRS